MIPQAYITEWAENIPWKFNEQVEQDLIISRAIVEIFSDEFLAESLAFRGGTALHKLYLNPQPRYSEDIDLVQIKAEPFGPIIDKIRERLNFLGEPKRIQKDRNNTLIFRFESEIQPVQPMKLKVETNCREHFSVFGLKKINYNIDSSWFQGECQITTYKIEELLGTKLRALYQRKKGRDLYDLYKALKLNPDIIIEDIIHAYKEYIMNNTGSIPAIAIFQKNLDDKMEDDEFLGDTTSLLRPNEIYEPPNAYKSLMEKIVEKM